MDLFSFSSHGLVVSLLHDLVPRGVKMKILSIADQCSHHLAYHIEKPFRGVPWPEHPGSLGTPIYSSIDPSSFSKWD